MSDVRFTFKRSPAHMGEDNRTVYANQADGLPTPAGFKPSRWVGTVYPCPTWAPKALCLKDGHYCEGWHGSTHTGQLEGMPQSHTFGHGSRKDAARALWDQRVKWASEVTA
jgi:hypothetical protein